MKYLYAIGIWLALEVCASAQTPVFRVQAPLPVTGGAKITEVMQDSRGWMWCGAENGLFRYDGLSFQPIVLADTFSHAAVSALCEWDGKIWAGFTNGAIGSAPLDGNFPLNLSGDQSGGQQNVPQLQIWDIEEGLPRQKITAFAVDISGALWFSTYGEGVYVWKNRHLYQFNQEDDGLAGDDIYTITADTYGRIWAATDAGISVCAMPEAGKKQVVNIGIAQGLPDEIVTSLSSDAVGNIWVGMQEKGIAKIDAQTFHCEYLTPEWKYGEISGMCLFGKRELWVGTIREGLIRFDLDERRAYPLPELHAHRHSRTRALFKDREGLLWAVLGKGLLHSANVKFSLWEPGFSNVQTLLRDHEKHFWVGTDAGLFWQKNGVFQKILSENVISLWESPNAEIWCGTFGNGVFVLDRQGRTLRKFDEHKGLPNGSILSIGGDAKNVWLATLGGVVVWNADSTRFVSVDAGLQSSYVYKVFCDHSNRLWFGTDGKGLGIWENGKMRFIAQIGSVHIKTVYSIAEDPLGRIWFTTERDGLFCYDGSQFRQYTTENGLHDQRLEAVGVDGNGRVLIGYEDGVDLLNPERRDHVLFCSAGVGAPEVSVNLNAIFRDEIGNIWVGAKEGILRVAAFDENFVDDPQPAITAVSVFLKGIDFLNTNQFSFSDNYFIFNFAGLWFTDPEIVRYRYKLEGFDLNWNTTKDRLASYPKLPPGNYRFRLQTSEHGNFDEVPEASWRFEIRTPYWTSWWFILLSVIAVSAAFLSVIRLRDRRLNREAQLKRERVESQFEALKSQINPHFLFNSFNTLITIIEENPRIAVEYVEHLSDFYRSLIGYREREFISLQEEMELVNNFSFLLQKRYEKGLQIVSRLQGQSGNVLTLSLQMLVENAVKHNVISASKPLTVEIFSENDGYVTVRNNIQKKIKPEAGTRFGLQSLIKRYQLLGMRPVLVIDNGTHFTVKVPLV